jgi:hypothetical protein
MPIENNSSNFFGYFIGEVLEIDRTTRRLSVYISKFMTGIAGDQQVSTSIQTTTVQNIEGVNYNTSIRIRNSMWVLPWDYNEPLPKIGSKVIVFFIEGNPKLGFWDRFNPNNNYEVIDEERYPKLIGLTIGDKELIVNSEDTLNIVLPENTEIVYNEESKEKTVRILGDNKYVLSEQRPENPYPGMMWFDSKNQILYVYRGSEFEKVYTETELLVLIKLQQDSIDDLTDALEEVQSRLDDLEAE